MNGVEQYLYAQSSTSTRRHYRDPRWARATFCNMVRHPVTLDQLKERYRSQAARLPVCQSCEALRAAYLNRPAPTRPDPGAPMTKGRRS